MTVGSVRAAIITNDRAFREAVRNACGEQEPPVEIVLDLGATFSDFGEEQVRAVREAHADLVVLDLSDDPTLGIRLAHFLAQANPGQRFLAAGPMLPPEDLLAAMRAGIADYLPKPVDPVSLTESLVRLRLAIGHTREVKPQKPGEVLAFFSPKGGSGSTTMATNLAIVLHRLTGKRTLLVDLDLELGEVALMLGAKPRFNLVDLLQNFHRIDADLLASYIDKHESGVHLLSAPFHPERAETAGSDEIRRVLQYLRQHYDYVLVDTSKSFSPATLAAFERSDLVFLVTTADLPSLRNIQRALPMLKRTLARGDDQIRLVVNRYQADDEITLADVERTLGMKVYRTVANDYESVIRSVNTGRPIVLDGTSGYTIDIKALGADIAGLGASVNGRRRPGFRQIMGRVLRREEKKAHD